MTALLAAQSPSFAVPANIAFGIVAAMMIFCAIRVVTTPNIVHAALYLVGVLAGVGINYLLLQAEFVALTQFLVYIGAIIVLLLFGVMLTRAPLGESHDLDNKRQRPIAAITSLLLAAVLAGVLIDSFRGTKLPFKLNPFDNTRQISDSLFSTYLIPFEVVSVLLLAALIGAIVLARKD
jgi:NADH-quinone oxidoreductase subunit J